MSNTAEHRSLEDVWADVVGARDEVRLQLHLLSRDARGRWDELERTLEGLEGKVASKSSRVAKQSLVKAMDARDHLRSFIEDHLRRAGVLADPVGDVMTERAATCSPDDSLERAAEIMWNHDCGIVPVIDDGGRLVGVVTDRDVCIATYTRGVAPASASVATTMARALHTCGPQQSLADVLDLMAEEQVHRVPVTSAADGRLLGIVSLGDIARYVDGAMPSQATLAARARVVRALAAISRPRGEAGE